MPDSTQWASWKSYKKLICAQIWWWRRGLVSQNFWIPTELEKLTIFHLAMIDQRYTNVCLPLQHMQKDLRLAINMADSLNQPMPLTAIANEGYKHARRMGAAESDASAIVYRRWSTHHLWPTKRTKTKDGSAEKKSSSKSSQTNPIHILNFISPWFEFFQQNFS